MQERERTGIDLSRSLVMFYCWLVTTLCYYGLTFMATDLTGNFFSDYSLLIFVEIPAHFYCILALDRIGRKPILSFSLILSGLCCIVAAFVDSISWLQVRTKTTSSRDNKQEYLQLDFAVDSGSGRKVRSGGVLHHRLRLHGRAVSHRDQVHGHRLQLTLRSHRWNAGAPGESFMIESNFVGGECHALFHQKDHSAWGHQ